VHIDILVRLVGLTSHLRALDLPEPVGPTHASGPMVLSMLRDIAGPLLVRLKLELQVHQIESWTPLGDMPNLRMLFLTIRGALGESARISAWNAMPPLLLSKLVFLIWETYIMDRTENSAALAFLSRCRFISLQDFRIRFWNVVFGDEDHLRQFFVHHPNITSVRFDSDALISTVMEAVLPRIKAHQVSLGYIPEDVGIIHLLSTTVQELFLGIDYSAPLDDLWRLLRDLHEIYDTSIRYVVIEAQEGDDIPGPVTWGLMRTLLSSDEEHNMDWLARLVGHAWRLQEKGIDVLDEYGNIVVTQTVEEVCGALLTAHQTLTNDACRRPHQAGRQNGLKMLHCYTDLKRLLEWHCCDRYADRPSRSERA
jgi:hypothetical protein